MLSLAEQKDGGRLAPGWHGRTAEAANPGKVYVQASSCEIQNALTLQTTACFYLGGGVGGVFLEGGSILIGT